MKRKGQFCAGAANGSPTVSQSVSRPLYFGNWQARFSSALLLGIIAFLPRVYFNCRSDKTRPQLDMHPLPKSLIAFYCEVWYNDNKLASKVK
ncbi:MAG: hypothetical protein DYG89_23360 [Caldilinea sp. CFX5]|nr:hypothetical protein [Caldilinea sp. CFX5]